MSLSGSTVCTDPLPKLRSPITTARCWSCSAPATISDADADPESIKTTTGAPLARSPGSAKKRSMSPLRRPRCDTISPRSRNRSLIPTASSSNPPGFERRSTIQPRGFLPSDFSTAIIAARMSVVASAEKLVTVSTPTSPLTSHLTGFRSMTSRISDISIGLSWPSRTMVTSILVPGRPRICSTASSSVRPKISSLLIWVI